MSRLLIFGGTFDPPHCGHMSILQNAIRAVEPDRVLVVPAGLPPHKQGDFSPPALRLAMCACFAPLHPALEVSDMEIARGGHSYTVDTVETLRQEYPGWELYLCIGSDMLLAFETWRRWRELLAACTLVVQNRSEADVEPAQRMAERLRGAGGRVEFASGVVEEVSSTELRQRAAAGENLAGLVPPPADEIVRERALYRPGVTAGQARAIAQRALSKKRFAHVEGVARAAEALARRYGEDPERARLAAFLHDIAKEQSREELLQTLGQDAIMAGSTLERPYAVWHGPCAALYARDTLGIRDTELLDALCCHTTGRPGMTRLDKVLLVADRTSAERDYPGVEQIRAAAETDLDKAVVLALLRSVEHCRERGAEIDPDSERAIDDLRNKRPDLF